MTRKPGAIVVIVAVAVVAVCVWLAAEVVAMFAEPATPGAFFGGVMMFPVALGLGVAQYRAVFRRSVRAARLTALTCFVIAAFFGFGIVTSIGELIRMPGEAPTGAVWVFVFLAAVAGGTGGAGVVNRRWAKALAGPPPLGVCGGCGYDLRGNVSGVCPECGRGVPGGRPG